jgi:DNA-binding response OmpR family regulator
LNILLIDDEKICGDFAREAIQHEYPEVSVEQALDCCAGFRALEVNYGRYNAVILDLNLPGRDGLECLRVIREAWPEIPIVILTGISAEPAEEKRTQCLQAGADYFVLKQSALHLLGLAVMSAIEQRRSVISAEAFTCERRKVLSELREKNKLGSKFN